MRKFFWISIVLLTLGLMLALGLIRWPMQVEHRKLDDRPSAPTLAQVRALAVLTTLRIEITDVCETTVDGTVGGMKVVLLIHGDALLGIDLDRATFVAIDQAARRAVLQLPQPTVQAASLDHQRTRVESVQADGLWLIIPDSSTVDCAIFERALCDAEQRVRTSAEAEQLKERARLQAQAVLITFFTSVGWTIECRWSEQ